MFYEETQTAQIVDISQLKQNEKYILKRKCFNTIQQQQANQLDDQLNQIDPTLTGSLLDRLKQKGPSLAPTIERLLPVVSTTQTMPKDTILGQLTRRDMLRTGSSNIDANNSEKIFHIVRNLPRANPVNAF